MIGCALTAILLAATPHDGPAHRISALSKRMSVHGKTAPLLHQRAICFLELRQPADALKDLRAALRLDPRHESSLIEHVRVLVTLKRPKFALAAAVEAVPAVRKSALRALLARVHAEILTTLGRYVDAVAQCHVALRALPDQPRVVFRRSILRGLLGQPELRLRELDAYVEKRHPLPPIIEGEWIDAMIAVGDPRALPLVERRLGESRFQSYWLLRRARIRGGAAGDADLMATLRELSIRLRPTRPDVMLLADRALALHRLDQSTVAVLATLRKRNYPELLQLQLQLLMRN